eukprot:7178870-Pyramimonas_sp.AAC.3
MHARELRSLSRCLGDPASASARVGPLLAQAGFGPALCGAAKDLLLADPFGVELVRTAYLCDVSRLRTKTHVPVERGALLMGVPDPSGTLPGGCVFAQIQAPSDPGPTQILGAAMVYRNPCLHPGDIRHVTAVGCPALGHLVNVVVFPARAGAPPTAAQCSGGDLDGDLFAVVWDRGLVLPAEAQHEACDYDAVLDSARRAHERGSEKPAQSLAEAFVRVVSNETLGRVAHMHLAICDQLPGGACHPMAVTMSQSQCLAVDYPKTGVPPTVPKEALKQLRSSGYPDFMEKGDCASYPSTKLLGE